MPVAAVEDAFAPRVTALVCTKDRSELLGDCLRSLDVALGSSGELVVVEFGDSGAVQALDGLSVGSTLISAPRSGKSRQLNLGVSGSSGDVIVCTDDDCRVEPTWVGAMTAPFADPAVGVVFGPVRGLTGVRGTAGPAHLEPGPAPAVTWHYANGAAMAIRRRMIEEIGGYDERLGPGAPQHGEEHDVVLRAQEAGWLVWVADAPAVGHVEWRDLEEQRRNMVVYHRGAGAFVGAALRRDPSRWARLAVRRVRYQLRMWRFWRQEGLLFGARTTGAFVGGLVAGLRLTPRRWLP